MDFKVSPYVYNLYVIFDRKSGLYSHLSYEQNDALALRQFRQLSLFERPDNVFFTNKDDFDLYCIGQIDVQTGSIVSQDRRLISNV